MAVNEGKTMFSHEEALKQAEKHEKLAEHYRMIAELEGGESKSPPRSRGRRGRPAKTETSDKESRSDSLPSLLMDVAQKSKKPLKLEEFVSRVLEAGYKSNAKNFSNIVYQSLARLVKSKVLEKEQKEYKVVAA